VVARGLRVEGHGISCELLHQRFLSHRLQFTLLSLGFIFRELGALDLLCQTLLIFFRLSCLDLREVTNLRLGLPLIFLQLCQLAFPLFVARNRTRAIFSSAQ
jgi:hypothetical protein